MLEDLQKNVTLLPTQPDAASIDKLVRERQPQFISFADWKALDKLEVAKGVAQGRPRVKFTCVDEMLAALGRK